MQYSLFSVLQTCTTSRHHYHRVTITAHIVEGEAPLCAVILSLLVMKYKNISTVKKETIYKNTSSVFCAICTTPIDKAYISPVSIRRDNKWHPYTIEIQA